jgi:hypothetical protein
MKVIHTVPDNDIANHYHTPRCQCNPFYIHDQHLVHNAYDHREVFKWPWYKLSFTEFLLKLYLIVTKKVPDKARATWTNWEVVEKEN